VQAKLPCLMVVVVVEPLRMVVVLDVVVEVDVVALRVVVVVAMVVVDVVVVGARVVDVVLVVGLVVDVVVARTRVVEVVLVGAVVVDVVVVLVDVVGGGPSVVVVGLGSHVHSLVHCSSGGHSTPSSPHCSPFPGSRWPSPHWDSVAVNRRLRGRALLTMSVPVSVSQLGAATKPFSSLARAGLPARSSRPVHGGHAALTFMPPLEDLRTGLTATQPMLLVIAEGWMEIASMRDGASPVTSTLPWTRKRPPRQGSGLLLAGAANRSDPESAVERTVSRLRRNIDLELPLTAAGHTCRAVIVSSSPPVSGDESVTRTRRNTPSAVRAIAAAASCWP